MTRFSTAVRPLLVTIVLTAGLAACGKTDRIVATSIPMDDAKVRHPIALTDSATSIDVFPSGGSEGLDRHTAKQVFAFAQQYRELGHGPISILVPRGRTNHAAIAEIRRVLALGGVRAPVDVSTYPVADRGLASAVRISYQGTRAVVADQCGQWPRDLASGSSVEGWDNKPYWNFGCATQTMIAAQTSDPRDLVTPRGEEPADTLVRAHNIDSIRHGADPNTNWAVKSTNISGLAN